MPSKNRLKLYIEDGYYHLFNRGVEKRPIFLDAQDYAVFSSYMATYLLPKDEILLRAILADPKSSYREKDQAIRLLNLNNFYGKIKLLSYCLMPNHFHFLVKQAQASIIDQLINSLCTRYSMYFNRKYNRVGPLYQGVYKAVNIETEIQLLYVSAYIHRNPFSKRSVFKKDPFSSFYSQPSSLSEYIRQKKTAWIYPDEVLSYFSKTNPTLSYQSFVLQTDDFSLIEDLLLDI